MLLFMALPWLLKIFAPFIFGGVLYFAASPLNKALKNHHIPSLLSALLSLLIISGGIFLILKIIGGKIFDELYSFTRNPPLLYTSVINSAAGKISALTKTLNVNTPLSDTVFPMLTEALKNLASSAVSRISEFLIAFAKKLPSVFIASFASVFTGFFMLKDGDKIFPLLKKFFGSKVYGGFLKFKETFFSVFASYIKAQLIIEGIIFAVLLGGFLFLKVGYAFVLSLITAIVDAVPVFGTGTVLLPLSLFFFLTNEATLGWGILVLYGITLLTRQLCEPKILGNSLGIHPLITVFSLYAGMKILGVFGLILGPFLAIFIKILLFSS